ncbi:hypothetical protein NBRC10512v2_007361 [Rhodotorula toruloides]
MTTDGEQSIYLFFKNISTLGEVGAGRKGWRLRMEQALKTGDIYKHGTGISVGASQDANADVPARATTAAKQAMWDLDDACAINYMISKLPDNIAGQLLNLTAHQIWFHLMSNFDVGNTESIQSIFAAICWLKAKNLVLEAVDTFLVKHEEILSCAHQIDSPLPIWHAQHVYSDFILEGLPVQSDTEWKAWTSIQHQSDLSTFTPRNVLGKVQANYNHQRAVAALSGGLLLNGNSKASSLSSTAATTVGKGSSPSSEKTQQLQQQQRPKCKLCQEENPSSLGRALLAEPGQPEQLSQSEQ